MMRKTLCLAAMWLCLLPLSSWASNMRSIAKDQVNIRSEPSVKSEVLFQAGLGYPIEVERQKDNWLYFRDWKDNTGWVYRPLVSDVQTAVITAENANIRKGPSLGRPVVMRASRGEIYKVFGERGHWVKVGYYLENEVIGWVRNDLVWGE